MKQRRFFTTGTFLNAAIAAVAFSIGYAAHYGLAGQRTPAPETGERERIAAHRLTSPFVECLGAPASDLALLGVRDSIEAIVAEAKGVDPSFVASVYVRDLNNGPWISVNAHAAFVPASLLKLPALYYVLGRGEDEPDYLNEAITFPGAGAMTAQDNSSDLPPDQRMQAGQSYTRLQLLERMIALSDNHAKELLMADVPGPAVEAMMHALGFDFTYEGNEVKVTTAEYASLFRILYNSSFFSRPLSELALDILSRNYYPDGLRRGLPPGITVASKFGLHHGLSGDGSSTQLHECGIVYHPDSPYVLCVMTRSARAGEAQLASVIARVSGAVYRGTLAD